MSNPSLMRGRLLGGAAALVLMATGAHSTQAWAADWKMVEMAGQVRVAVPGVQPVAARQGQVLPIGSSVTTLAGGRAVLDNGLQHIVVGPNSRMTLAPEQAAGMGRVVQDLGAIFFQVDKKDKPHFRVETPLLAAVVKGTSFTVEVDALADTVNVAEGLVEVRSNRSELSRDVPGGASATITRDAPAAVEVVTLTSDTIAAGPEPVAVLPPIDYAAASDGLIGGVGPVVAAVRAAEPAPAAAPAPMAEPTPQPAQAFAAAGPASGSANAGGGVAVQLASVGARDHAGAIGRVEGPTSSAAEAVAGRGKGNGNGGPAGDRSGADPSGRDGPKDKPDNGNGPGGGPGGGGADSAAGGRDGPKDKPDNGNGPGGGGPGGGGADSAAGGRDGPRDKPDNGNGPGGGGPGGGGADSAAGGRDGPKDKPDNSNSGPGGGGRGGGGLAGLLGGRK